jgi:hypothetical protein
MDNDKKRDDLVDGGADLPSTLDSSTRARNRTVMLTPEMTGQMRSRIGGVPDQGLGSSQPALIGRGGSSSHGGWEESPRPAFGGRLIGHEPGTQDDDQPDWTRPIEPAIVSTLEESLDGAYDPSSTGETSPMSWAPRGAEEETYRNEATSPPRVIASGSENQGYSAPTNGTYERYGSLPDSRNEHFQQPGTQQQDIAPKEVVSHRHREVEDSPMLASGRVRAEEVSWKNKTVLAGFLVSFDNDPLGAYIELRTGRIIVTSDQEATGNSLVIDHESVSPMHAIMRVAGGATIQILDQLSESGTRIFRAGSDDEELLSGEKSTLSHGDTVIFGDRKYHVCLLNCGVEKNV